MAEKITAEQALEKLDAIAGEWVEKDLEKGIPLPFRFWRGGQYKDRITFVLWRSLMLPLILMLVVVTCAIHFGLKIFVISLVCYILYWIIGAALWKREKGNFILKTDGVMIVTQRDKLYIPWEAIKEICSDDKGGLAYKLIIQVENRKYVFYELYAKNLVQDSDGRIAKAMMPLYVAYTMLTMAKSKVHNN